MKPIYNTTEEFHNKITNMRSYPRDKICKRTLSGYLTDAFRAKKKINKASKIVITNEKLLQMLANATKTYMGCNGHNKALCNKQRMKEFEAQLKDRGVNIPDDRQLSKNGIFNGEGAY